LEVLHAYYAVGNEYLLLVALGVVLICIWSKYQYTLFSILKKRSNNFLPNGSIASRGQHNRLNNKNTNTATNTTLYLQLINKSIKHTYLIIFTKNTIRSYLKFISLQLNWMFVVLLINCNKFLFALIFIFIFIFIFILCWLLIWFDKYLHLHVLLGIC